MKKLWEALASVLTKAAIYAAEHPDQVIAIATAAKNLK